MTFMIITLSVREALGNNISQFEFIQSLKLATLAYTPGVSDPQPTPQVTSPTTVHLPDWA